MGNNLKAYYQDVEFTDSTEPDFTEATIIRYEDLSWADGFDDVVSEAYPVWERNPHLVACSYMGEIFWFITEEGHMYDKDNDGFYLEGFFVGTKEIHIDPFGYYTIY